MNVPKLHSPIVFVHGLLGFDKLQVGGYTVASYFGKVPDHLREAGNNVKVASLSPTAGIADRALQLQEYLNRESPHDPVHIFAHSMGGLDSRYLISRLGMADRVLTLTTFGTPHRGSPFADWGIRRLEFFIKPVVQWLGIPYQAFYDLTTTKCKEFNDQVPDAPKVRYFSIAGRHQGAWRSPEWLLPHQIVTAAEGPNDGVVSVKSATYGESVEVWEGDHLSLADFPNPVASAQGLRQGRTPEYAKLVQRLADEGF